MARMTTWWDTHREGRLGRGRDAREIETKGQLPARRKPTCRACCDESLRRALGRSLAWARRPFLQLGRHMRWSKTPFHPPSGGMMRFDQGGLAQALRERGD